MLSNEQKVAVDTEGNVLLVACPWSWKTRVLTYRMIREISKNKDTNRLVAWITFTNVAAEELEYRIINNTVGNGKHWSWTIHSFCNEWIIKPYMCYHEILKNGYDICDEYKSFKILSELKQRYRLNYYDQINTKRNLDGSFMEVNRVKINILNEYYSILEEYKLIDYDTLLFYSYELIKDNDFISLNLSNIFSLICLDEFQDTSDLQYNIIAKIINQDNQKTNIYIAWDRDQAIYHSLWWVAKSDEEIRQLYKWEFKILPLSWNYRSNQKIIDYYRYFQIENINIQWLNENIQLEEATITYNSQDYNKDNIYELIANYVRSSLDLWYLQDDICVVAPSWQDLLHVEKELKHIMTDVNFYSVNSTSILRKSKDFATWYKIAKLNLMPRTSNYFLYRLKLAKEIISELEVFLDTSLIYKPKDILKIINSMIIDSTDVIEYLETLFLEFLKEIEIDITLYSKLSENYNSFLEKLEAYRNENIENWDTNITIDSIKKSFHNFEGVKISTIHWVKWEEYKTVIAFWLLQWKLPNWWDIISRNHTYTERIAKRLMYVIGSRAKNRLHLISENWHITRGNKPLQITNILKWLEYDYDITY